MVQPYVLNNRFFFNIDANVGLNSPNKEEDVQLVQMGYFAASTNPETPADLKPIYAKVTPGAAYKGDANDPLTVAIIAHQKSRGGTQDGHVSVIRGVTYDGAHTYMLTALNNNLIDLQPADFPRLDKHAKCPQVLRAAVKRCCTGG